MRAQFLALFLVPALAVAACASTVPKPEIDRCVLGVADGNDALTLRQGPACTLVAKRLAADSQPGPAMGYARKACDLEDPRGCVEYLALARSQPNLAPDELMHARATGQKACAGMVVSADGVDVRAEICARTAELFKDIAPSSPDDAGRLYARACKLGDDASCARASKLGADLSGPTLGAPQAKANSTAAPQPLPPPTAPPLAPTAVLPPAPACHEMRACVSLEVSQRNVAEVVGTSINHCDKAVTCKWCPSHGDTVDKNAGCHSRTLAVGERISGREGGLWWDGGYNSIAYDCMDAMDVKNCLGF